MAHVMVGVGAGLVAGSVVQMVGGSVWAVVTSAAMGSIIPDWEYTVSYLRVPRATVKL